MDVEAFLSRLPNHPRREAISAAVAECIKVANDFTAAKATLKAGDRLTARGVTDVLNDTLGAYAARLAAARKPIDALAAEAATRRAAMKPRGPEPSDLASAVAHMETRTFLRSLQPLERMKVLLSTGDIRLLEAAMAAPPEVSGITDKESADRIEARWMSLAHAAELAAVDELEQLAAVARDAATVARDELRRTVDMDERMFTAKVGPAESRAALPWIRKDGTRVLVVEVGENGAASYRAATEWEAKAGVEYANLAEYNAARGVKAAA